MFGDACAVIEAALEGGARRQIVAEVSGSRHFRTALIRLRDSMRSNVWKAGATEFPLGRIVRAYDSLTRRDGFHVMHDWDGIADRVNEDTIPVDVLNYIVEQRGGGETDAAVLSILLDYYFLHVLALLSLRIWDVGDADVRLRRIGQLLDRLQGPDGSGQRFAANAETLILLATSHFEIDERGYDTLLAKVKTLGRPHQTNVGLGHAASMGGHLRFGFEATYARDTVIMRNDNVTDYPWLSFSLATLMREYSRMRAEGVLGPVPSGVEGPVPSGVEGPVPSGVEGPDRDAICEAMLNGLSPDARAFVGEAAAAPSPYESERAEFCDLFRRYQQELLAEFERFRPSTATYSPLSFFFNFSHNVVKGAVVDALLRGKPWTLTLNDMLTGISRGAEENAEKEALATTLMGYARANPHQIRGRLMPVIVYDPAAGRRAFSVTMQKLQE